MRHFNIPVFVPEIACPFRCVFCNQRNISAQNHIPDSIEIKETIDSSLSTFPTFPKRIEVAFFGGSFSGMSQNDQNKYLDIVQPYINSGQVDGIRISTRPDYINHAILDNLKEKGVVAIELGAQSLDNEVLAATGRGHTVEDVIQASKMIFAAGFELGLQMMTGLPGDTPEKSIQTARMIVELKAHTTRIYPCLVIRDTKLEELYRSGLYMPQGLDDAVALAARLYVVFNKAGVKILRMGLHPSESLISGESLVLGPFHPAFGQMILTKVWGERINTFLSNNNLNGKQLTITVHPDKLNSAIGYKAENKIRLKTMFSDVKFYADINLDANEFRIDCC